MNHGDERSWRRVQAALDLGASSVDTSPLNLPSRLLPRYEFLEPAFGLGKSPVKPLSCLLPLHKGLEAAFDLGKTAKSPPPSPWGPGGRIP